MRSGKLVKDRGVAFSRRHLLEMQLVGGDEDDAAWLEGGGLKFHTTADKAFAMAQQRFKDSEAVGGAGP